MRTIWNGTISFGLVNIPISVFTAVKDRPFEFHFLHKKDRGRIRNQRVCEKCGQIVDYADLERGFEYEKDKYVALTERDLEKVSVESNKHIEISDFVAENEINPMLLDKPYYLAPGRDGVKAYVLLREVLKRTQKVGIGRLALRTREQLAAIRPNGTALILEMLHFADELRASNSLELPPTKERVDKRELDLAEELISHLTTHFDPKKYPDTYNDALQALIKRKLSGKPIRVSTKSHKATNVVDIMSRLKASLKQAKGGSHRRKKVAA